MKQVLVSEDVLQQVLNALNIAFDHYQTYHNHQATFIDESITALKECVEHSQSPSEIRDSVPYPGMSEAFETYYAQSFTDRDWRNESSVWAAAWKAAIAAHQPAPIREPVAYVVKGGYCSSACMKSLGEYERMEGWEKKYYQPVFTVPG